jgi:hypothetical protein
VLRASRSVTAAFAFKNKLAGRMPAADLEAVQDDHYFY